MRVKKNTTSIAGFNLNKNIKIIYFLDEILKTNLSDICGKYIEYTFSDFPFDHQRVSLILTKKEIEEIQRANTVGMFISVTGNTSIVYSNSKK